MTPTQPPGARWWPRVGMLAAMAAMFAVVLAASATPAHADPHLPDAAPGASPAAPAPSPSPSKAEPTPPPSTNEPSPGLTPTPPVKETPRPQPTPAPSPGPAPTPPPETGGGDSGDGVSFWDIPGQIRQAITHWLADLIRPFVTPLINSLVRGLLTTPNPAEQPRVVELWEAMRLIALGGYGLFVLAAGITTMTHGSVQQRWSAQDVIPRLVLGIAASNLSLTICSTTLTIANALASGIFGEGISADDVAGTFIGLILTQISPAAPLYMLVFTLAVTVLGSALLITVLVRTASTIVLTVASPLMLACHAHPSSDGIARLWWRAYLGCLGTEIAQAVIFLVCVKALLDPGNYGLIPVPDAAGLINLMLLCCTLYLLLKVPGWIRRIVTTPARTITGGGGPRIGGLRILRKIAIGAATGMPMGPYAFGARLGGKLRTARGAARATSAASPAAGPGPTPTYTWGRPRRNGPGNGGPRPGGTGPGRAPGGPGKGPSGGGPAGTGPSGGCGPRSGTTPPPSGGPGTPSGAGPAGLAPGSGSRPGNGPAGPGTLPSHQWGRPRRRTPGNLLGASPPPSTAGAGPALPPSGCGGPGPRKPRSLPSSATGTSSRHGPPPAIRPTAVSNLRPARVNLPPPLPRPAVLRPPLDEDPPGTRRGRKPR